MNFLALLFATCIPLALSEKFYYEGFKVYQVTPKTLDEAKLLSEFENDENFDFWTDIHSLDAPVDIMVTPGAQDAFEDVLKYEDIKYSVMIENVREIIENEEENRRGRALKVAPGEVTFTEFMRHGEILAYLDQLAADYPDVASTEIIGKSFEGRDLKVLKISTGGSNKPIIFIEAAIHAREWIAPPVALYIIRQLVEDPSNADMIRDIDWIIHPVVNPDGYEYTHTTARLWRKTRTPGTICDGVDGNRNFDYQWMLIGASSWQCTETYAGHAAFSEVETQAVRNVLLSNKGRVKLFIDLHSYGQLLMYPWGFTNDPPENIDELRPLGLRVNESIFAVRGTPYNVGNSLTILYAVSGGSRDYAAAEADVNLSFTIELPRGGTSGFDPLPSDIIPVVEETWEGIKVFYEHVQDNYVN